MNFSISFCEVRWLGNQVLKLILLFLLVTPVSSLYAQLLPSIGLSELPTDDDSICEILWRVSNDFDTLGFIVGEDVSDFLLYTSDGDSMRLKTMLATGKPTLLITCSYTCNFFRDNLEAIQNLRSAYGNDINIVFIY